MKRITGKKTIDFRRLIRIPLALIGVAFVIRSIPDLIRYIKIETM